MQRTNFPIMGSKEGCSFFIYLSIIMSVFLKWEYASIKHTIDISVLEVRFVFSSKPTSFHRVYLNLKGERPRGISKLIVSRLPSADPGEWQPQTLQVQLNSVSFSLPQPVCLSVHSLHTHSQRQRTKPVACRVAFKHTGTLPRDFLVTFDDKRSSAWKRHFYRTGSNNPKHNL